MQPFQPTCLPIRGWRVRALMLGLALSMTACSENNPQILLNEARAHRDRGELRSAVIQLKNALQHDNNLADARLLLGEVYLEQGEALSAEKELQRALALAPASQKDTIRLSLAKAYLQQGQFAKTLAELRQSASLHDQPPARCLRGDALLGLEKPDQATLQYNAALAQRPRLADAMLGLARIALARGDKAQTDDLLKRALAANPGHLDALRFRADVYRAHGQPEAALATYQQLLALRPHMGHTHTDIASIHSDAGRYAQAATAIAAARKATGPTLAVAYAQAMLDFRQRKLSASLESVQQILRVAPEHYPSLLLAGTIEAAMGAHEQAVHHLQQFLQAHPRHLYASKCLISLHMRMGRHDRALALATPLMAAHANDVELLALAGEANLQLRRYSVAAQLFEQASALKPKTAELHTALALSRLGSGENGRAVAELVQAASLDHSSQRNAVLLVMTHLRDHAPAKALEVASAMEQRSDNPLVQNLKGGVYLAMRDTARARASFHAALAYDPLYLPALANLAQLDKSEQKTDQAVKRYEAALAKSPGNAALMESLAGLALARGKQAEAVTWLERACKHHPDDVPLALRLAGAYAGAGDQRKALVLAQQLHASHPSNTDALTMLAQTQSVNGQVPAAIASYTQLAALTPSAPMPHMRLAHLHLASGDQTAALAALRKVLSLAPDAYDAQLTLLNMLVRQKKFSDAHALAASVRQRQPKSPTGYKMEGDVHAAQDRYSAALASYERAFALAPSGAALIQVHGALSRLGKRDEADHRVTRWLRTQPNDVPTRLYMASSKLVANDLKGAVADLEAVLRLEPDNVMALNDIAWALQRLNGKSALGYAERAYGLAPGNPSVLDTLGWIHMETGNPGRALPLLQKAGALAPQAAEIYFHLGVVLAKLGDRPGARRALEQALASRAAFARRDEVLALLATL